MKAMSQGKTRKGTEGGRLSRRGLLKLAAAAPLAAIGVEMRNARPSVECCYTAPAPGSPSSLTLTVTTWMGKMFVTDELLEDVPFDFESIVAAALALQTHAAQVGQ